MSKEDRPETPSEPEEEGLQTKEAAETGLSEEEIEEALREKDQFRTMAQRAQADLVNYKRRAEEEREETRRAATSHLLLRILAILDDLKRALTLIPEDAVAPGWLDGLLLVQRNIEGILDAEGVSKIEVLGRPFDPWECEAVFHEETQEEEEGRVTKVIRDGYKLYDNRVLRAAQVVVSKRPESTVQPDNYEEAQ